MDILARYEAIKKSFDFENLGKEHLDESAMISHLILQEDISIYNDLMIPSLHGTNWKGLISTLKSMKAKGFIDYKVDWKTRKVKARLIFKQ